MSTDPEQFKRLVTDRCVCITKHNATTTASEHRRNSAEMFGFNKWESVSVMLLGLGRLNINHYDFVTYSEVL